MTKQLLLKKLHQKFISIQVKRAGLNWIKTDTHDRPLLRNPIMSLKKPKYTWRLFRQRRLQHRILRKRLHNKLTPRQRREKHNQKIALNFDFKRNSFRANITKPYIRNTGKIFLRQASIATKKHLARKRLKNYREIIFIFVKILGELKMQLHLDTSINKTVLQPRIQQIFFKGWPESGLRLKRTLRSIQGTYKTSKMLTITQYGTRSYSRMFTPRVQRKKRRKRSARNMQRTKFKRRKFFLREKKARSFKETFVWQVQRLVSFRKKRLIETESIERYNWLNTEKKKKNKEINYYCKKAQNLLKVFQTIRKQNRNDKK